jgi:hypothetical protein
MHPLPSRAIPFRCSKSGWRQCTRPYIPGTFRQFIFGHASGMSCAYRWPEWSHSSSTRTLQPSCEAVSTQCRGADGSGLRRVVWRALSLRSDVVRGYHLWSDNRGAAVLDLVLRRQGHRVLANVINAIRERRDTEYIRPLKPMKWGHCTSLGPSCLSYRTQSTNYFSAGWETRLISIK